ncbi:MAG TPA: LCP family protein [Ruminococcus sp.]|nr:LCP family protein [Ruminococcus sp.]
MAKKKSGSIAVPFLVTIFIGLIIVGGAAFGIYKYFGLGGDDTLKKPIPRQVTLSTYEDSHTILFILDAPDTKCSSTFVLMRSVPKDKKLTFIGIPSNTIALIDDAQQSIKGSYERGGPSAAVDFTQALFNIKIDRYLKFDPEAFIKTCEILGGVTYPVSEDIAGFKSDSDEQFLNAEQIKTLVTYSMYRGGEVQRAFEASSIVSEMMNQAVADGGRVADSLDASFNTVINMSGIKTDITGVDYKKRKVAIKNMLERGSSIASCIALDGADADADFIPSTSAINNIVDEYFKDPTE